MSASAPDKQQKRLADAMKSGEVAHAYHLHGADEHRKDDALHVLLGAVVDPATRDFNLDVRRGPELTAESLGSLLATPPMMAARRVVVLRDPDGMTKEPRAVLDRWCAAPPPDVLLVLVSPAGAKVDKSLPEAVEAVEFPLLEGDRLLAWIMARARTLGGEIVPGAAALLVAAVGNETAALVAELDKLASYANGAVIDEAAVTAAVGVRRGETLTDLMDAVAAKDAARAVGLIEQVLSQPKMTAVYVVLSLAKQVLVMAYGRSRVDAGLPPGRLTGEYVQIFRESGGPIGRQWGEAASVWARHTMAWSDSEYDRALEALLAADVALKTTTVTRDAQVVATVILAMCAGARARSAA
ncbi:MAG: DNA polymerase III subunit delta [Gemmatimonadetes bacterium]|nr:DNA polymerase III subunit delta [Gemmatimonadota bacterium]